MSEINEAIRLSPVSGDLLGDLQEPSVGKQNDSPVAATPKTDLLKGEIGSDFDLLQEVPRPLPPFDDHRPIIETAIPEVPEEQTSSPWHTGYVSSYPVSDDFVGNQYEDEPSSTDDLMDTGFTGNLPLDEKKSVGSSFSQNDSFDGQVPPSPQAILTPLDSDAPINFLDDRENLAAAAFTTSIIDDFDGNRSVPESPLTIEPHYGFQPVASQPLEQTLDPNNRYNDDSPIDKQSPPASLLTDSYIDDQTSQAFNFIPEPKRDQEKNSNETKIEPESKDDDDFLFEKTCQQSDFLVRNDDDDEDEYQIEPEILSKIESPKNFSQPLLLESQPQSTTVKPEDIAKVETGQEKSDMSFESFHLDKSDVKPDINLLESYETEPKQNPTKTSKFESEFDDSEDFAYTSYSKQQQSTKEEENDDRKKDDFDTEKIKYHLNDELKQKDEYDIDAHQAELPCSMKLLNEKLDADVDLDREKNAGSDSIPTEDSPKYSGNQQQEFKIESKKQADSPFISETTKSASQPEEEEKNLGRQHPSLLEKSVKMSQESSDSTVTSSCPCPFSPGAWFNSEKLQPHVSQLIYWRNPRNSGIVFTLGFVLLLSLACCSIISVVAWTSLITLFGTLSFRVYKTVVSAIQKTDDGHPFKDYLDTSLETSDTDERVHQFVDVILKHLKSTVVVLRDVFLVKEFFESLKYFLVFWVLTYLGSWFNGMTLVILAYLALFSVPKAYEMNKAQVDTYLDLARAQVNDVLEKVKAKIPFPGAKKDKSQ